MVGAPVRLGPFIGGINNVSDPSVIEDTQLVDCVNFDTDLDGSLVSRPPIAKTSFGTWTERILIIGKASFGGTNYIIGSNVNGTYAFDGTTWTLIQANLTSKCAVQFFDRLWIVPIPGEVQSGGSWSPSAGFVSNNQIPQGESAIFYKQRMWVASGKSANSNPWRLFFSDVITSVTMTFDSANIIDVKPGDGQKLVELAVYDDFLILFKTDSTYVLAYDQLISDAQLQILNPVIGCSTYRGIVQYESSIFTYHEGKIYEMSSLAFQKVNEFITFEEDFSAPSPRTEQVFLSQIKDRLIFRFHNRIYVLNLRNGAWVRWLSAEIDRHNFGPLTEMPSPSTSKQYYGGSCLTANNQDVFVINSEVDSIAQEEITCSIKTKNYDLSESHHFKKLAWWGADVLTVRDIMGRANPVTLSFQPTWNDLHSYTWNDLHDRTWDNLLEVPAPVESAIIDVTGLAKTRTLCKFPKALRFRQINFELEMNTNGTLDQGPCRVFTLTAIVGVKQVVPKQVN